MTSYWQKSNLMNIDEMKDNVLVNTCKRHLIVFVDLMTNYVFGFPTKFKPVDNTTQLPTQVGSQLVLMLNIAHLHLDQCLLNIW